MKLNEILRNLGMDRLSRLRLYHTFWIITDFLTVVAAYTVTFFIRTLASFEEYAGSLFNILAAALFTTFLLQLNGVYRRIWQQTGGREIHVLVYASLEAGIVITMLNLLSEPRFLPLSVIGMGHLLSLFAFTAFRYRARLISGLWWRWQAIWWGKLPKDFSRVLVVGAGQSGQLFVSHSITAINGQPHFKIVGFVDDATTKQRRLVEGKPILGKTSDIPAIVREHHIDMIVLAIHNSSAADFRRIVDACQKSEAQIKVMPDVFNVLSKPYKPEYLREIQIEDIIGRSSIPLNAGIDISPVTNKVILVTGAAGSIGSELSQQLAQHKPQELILLDNNESALHDLTIDLKMAFSAVPIMPILCDVSEKFTLTHVFSKHRPQIVFHAAAYKHVPLLENHPHEAVRTNLRGTYNVANLAQEYKAERFVLISSDKAVNSTSVMGATKYICERMVYSLAETAPKKSTLMCMVRFGNVLGSRGSVVPLFERQIKAGGPVTVTDERMTRYFMSIPEAVHLIIQAACMGDGLGLYILEMGESVRIVDLAKRMIRLKGLRPHKDIPIEFTGIRPGETLHETLLIEGERRCPTQHPYIIAVESPPVDSEKLLSSAKQLFNGYLTAETEVLKGLVLNLARGTQNGK